MSEWNCWKNSSDIVGGNGGGGAVEVYKRNQVGGQRGRELKMEVSKDDSNGSLEGVAVKSAVLGNNQAGRAHRGSDDKSRLFPVHGYQLRSPLVTTVKSTKPLSGFAHVSSPVYLPLLRQPPRRIDTSAFRKTRLGDRSSALARRVTPRELVRKETSLGMAVLTRLRPRPLCVFLSSSSISNVSLSHKHRSYLSAPFPFRTTARLRVLGDCSQRSRHRPARN